MTIRNRKTSTPSTPFLTRRQLLQSISNHFENEESDLELYKPILDEIESSKKEIKYTEEKFLLKIPKGETKNVKEEHDVNKSTESEDSGVGDLSLVSFKKPFIKAKLSQTWTFGCLLKGKTIHNWRSKYDDFARVESMDDFWTVYHHLGPASKIPPGCDYSLFKEGIIPAWEDQANERGGRWIIHIQAFKMKNREAVKNLDEMWKETLMFLINELWMTRDLVTGACISQRRGQFKIAVWLKDSRDNLRDVLRVGHLLKRKLGLQQAIKFSVHAEEKLREEDKLSWRRVYGHLPEIWV